MKLPPKGGQARISEDDYIEGAPELAAEIAGSSCAYDLHQKKGAYRGNGILEYPGLDYRRASAGVVGIARAHLSFFVLVIVIIIVIVIVIVIGNHNRTSL